MKKSFVVSALLFLVLVAQSAHAVTVYYQPTPYPLKKADGTAMPQSINIVHAWTGWLPSYYYGQTFQRDSKLQVGGWGDEYRTFIKLDLTGLPQSVDLAYFWLMPYARGDSSTPIPYAACLETGSWDLSLTWNTQPSYGPCYGWYSAPVPGAWSGFWLSYPGGSPNWYNSWKNGTLANNGIMLLPYATNNNFDVFYSTLYNDYLNDPLADGRRPVLQLNFTPTLQLKMPLPGNINWLATTEMGGWDCKGKYDKYHDDAPNDQGVMQYNYFSIDFSWRGYTTKDTNGNPIYVYPNPDPNNNRQNNGVYIPVIAAFGGKVIAATSDAYNGNYVVIDHDGDGILGTGFQTRYLHLQSRSVSEGAVVNQGDLLGYMGNTGISDGAHLHFGVRYQNSGAKTSPELAKVVMDGLLLKSYQTECAVNGSGVPTDLIRYYHSSNRAY
jgi:hypothetical protein